MEIKTLVLYGYGINCDNETKRAFELAGAPADRVHLNELIEGKVSLADYQIMAIPGGFSFGDDLGAGKIMATKIKYTLADKFADFIKQGKLLIGICNGFQVLVKLGILPGFGGKFDRQDATLAQNVCGRFQDRWIRLKFNQKSPCVWTKGIDALELPIRHGEGNFIPKDDMVLAKLEAQGQIVAQYVDEGDRLAGWPANPNGSVKNIAGICDETGRVFGLMPHPEGYLMAHNHPEWTRGVMFDGPGRKIFENAVDFAKTHLG